MALVDYSDDSSGSEAEVNTTAPVKSAKDSKKPFQKVVDRANPGKIVVSLPQTSAAAHDSFEEPPTKRAKTVSGAGKFSGFNSFLPAPKNHNKPASSMGAITSSSTANNKVGVNLKTSAAPGFSRDDHDTIDFTNSNGGGDHDTHNTSSNVNPSPAPSIPNGQTPADQVKMAGKPLMFKPLSVSRKPTKKKMSGFSNHQPTKTNGVSTDPQPATAAPPPPKKVSLFSIQADEPSSPPEHPPMDYQPMFEESTYGGVGAVPADSVPTGTTHGSLNQSQSLDTIADDLHLSAAERRELFGRGGSSNQAAKKVINFNMDREYEHNQQVRAAGEQQMHNPVRALQGGKHSLRQLVQNVHNQREALEDSFAKGKANRQEASSKYGW